MIAEQAAESLRSRLDLHKGIIAIWLHRKPGQLLPIVCFALNPDMDEQVKSMVEPKIPSTIEGFEICWHEWSTPIDIDAEQANQLFSKVIDARQS